MESGELADWISAVAGVASTIVAIYTAWIAYQQLYLQKRADHGSGGRRRRPPSGGAASVAPAAESTAAAGGYHSGLSAYEEHRRRLEEEDRRRAKLAGRVGLSGLILLVIGGIALIPHWLEQGAFITNWTIGPIIGASISFLGMIMFGIAKLIEPYEPPRFGIK